MSFRTLVEQPDMTESEYQERHIWRRQHIARVSFLPGRNMRFWEYINGDWVKITLHPGELLWRAVGGPTDEGWFSKENRLFWDGETLTHEWASSGQDCDGRMDRSGEEYATDLREHKVVSYDPSKGVDDVKFIGPVPDWTERKTSQRDHSAEAMGY